MTKLEAAQIRKRLGHPVIDADGHWIEPSPLFLQYLHEMGGAGIHRKFLNYLAERPHDVWYRMTPAERVAQRVRRPGWWQEPTETRDRATAMLPALLRERLDEFGFDVAIVYPTLGLQLMPL